MAHTFYSMGHTYNSIELTFNSMGHTFDLIGKFAKWDILGTQLTQFTLLTQLNSIKTLGLMQLSFSCFYFCLPRKIQVIFLNGGPFLVFLFLLQGVRYDKMKPNFTGSVSNNVDELYNSLNDS